MNSLFSTSSPPNWCYTLKQHDSEEVASWTGWASISNACPIWMQPVLDLTNLMLYELCKVTANKKDSICLDSVGFSPCYSIKQCEIVVLIVSKILLCQIIVLFSRWLLVTPFSGSGDGFFSSAFQSQLEGNSLYHAHMPKGTTVTYIHINNFSF